MAEGFLKVPGGRVYYRVVGQGSQTPILAVHGGPGGGLVSILAFAQLARCGRRVVFWDQLGCGRSDHPDDPALWTMARHVEEMEAVRRQLGLERVHLLGHSWGAMLALQYALEHGPWLASLSLLGGIPGAPAYDREGVRLQARLPGPVRSALERCRARGDYSSLEYRRAIAFFFGRHYLSMPAAWLGPLSPFMAFADWLHAASYRALSPEWLTRLFPGGLGRMVAGAQTVLASRSFLPMWGPDQFQVLGSLRHWDVQGRLGEVRVPTLVMCGRQDVASPLLAGCLADGIPGARLHVFERSAHFAMEEETHAFMDRMEQFLSGF